MALAHRSPSLSQAFCLSHLGLYRGASLACGFCGCIFLWLFRVPGRCGCVSEGQDIE